MTEGPLRDMENEDGAISHIAQVPYLYQHLGLGTLSNSGKLFFLGAK